MNEKIFKAYDIRGIYPDELNEEAAYNIGRAFISFLGKDSPEIVVGMDNRFSSGSLVASLEKGIIEQGGKVIKIGLCSSPMFYFAVAKYNYDGGIMVTASHNPKNYNGFKLVGQAGIPISSDNGLQQIKELVKAGNFKSPVVMGGKKEINILQDYVATLQNPNEFNYIIVVDTGNAVSGVPVPQILSKTGLIHIFDELDGNFPNHEPNPQIKENLRDLQSAIRIAGANLGVAFDGDGDRIFFLDEESQIIPADLILALVSAIILRKKGKQKIVYDLRCSNIVPETIKSWGGAPIMTKVGHSFIKQKMREEEAFFGGEVSGHYYAKEAFYSENPFFVVFTILSEMQKTKKSLSALIEPFQKYFHSDEINFTVTDPLQKIKVIKEKYGSQPKAKLLEIDGLRIDFEDWWFLVRASNTEPILRLIVEAPTHFLMEEKIKEISEIINE
ncbi:MAG TPA: phosphomannomutase/phosphoglucomutase [Candidatus Pacearchaeota archaeon]|nr:phosphomannomutase/phosphoglucomutase [Candidatus Pacearchaeota archaeon]